ncbi:hypothetical protein U5922_000300 (plasmid) [Aquicoccus sp. G2-2]|uniref:spermine/spermidine synthase domain-containing protein n=1 Tax=Aquicoccus sp. G2-2 TaxID=3092120 RepID=UPI002ADF7AB4|nr:hypothetical protein [Aquicoccus sp. G2-2]MEA1111978.1 hypothetical protein [Aquicoccus sp. G2-2]
MSARAKTARVSGLGSAQPLARLSLISLLATLSGACGLAYEVLLIRLFSNYFGDSFAIAGVILCAVFLGLAFGAWQSLRFVRWLAVVEIAIGIYAIIAATVLSSWGFEIAAFGLHPWVNEAKITLLLGLPAFLTGTCVPLFAAYAKTSRESKREIFPRIYGLYNLGAFTSVLAIEFILFRSLGLQITFYLIGCINLIIGGALLIWHRAPAQKSSDSPSTPVQKRIALALFLTSFASGMFQLFVLRLSFSIFGPLQENFAIILSSAIAGVAIGAWMSSRRLIRFEHVPFLSALFVLALLVFVPALVQIWSWLAVLDLGDQGETLAKTILLSGFPLPLFVLFGSLLPLAVAAHRQNEVRASGRLLAISSLGNGLGALAMFMLLYRILDLPQIGLVLASILLVAGVIAAGRRPALASFLKGAVIALALSFAAIQTWPRVELLLGYRILAQTEQLKNRLRDFDKVATYKAYDQSASVLSFRDGSRSLVFNGYHSLSFGPGGKSDLHETMVGATPALFTENTDRALVLGLGTGISGGATARVFGHTRIVEINPAILNIPAHFVPENRNVMERPNVEVVLQDGLSVLLGSGRRYDAIVNTVTSPKYYAASKLYTADFLVLAKSRLAEKGVYSTWFDLDIDREGIAIMLNTLEASFEHCRYFVMTASYYNAICADHPLIYQPRSVTMTRFENLGFDELLAKHGLVQDFATSLSALEVSFSTAFFARNTDEINTLDRPLIEFVVARNADKRATTEALSEVLVANIERQRQFSTGRQSWKENCRMIARMSYLKFSGCE